ncbi:aminodeoxychorismate synthase component I [Comamonadaceae bacterium PP-2]
MNAASVLIDFVAADPGQPALRGAFGPPREVLQAFRPEDVAAVLDRAHRAACDGAWCVGWVAYEAAAAFDRAFETADGAQAAVRGPLAWFAIFDRIGEWPHPSGGAAPFYRAGDWRDETDDAEFLRGMTRIAQAIQDGENYQVNYTTRLHGRFEGDARAFFQALLRSQPQSYAAYIDMGDSRILSVSPELFFDWRDGQLLSRPMKGTAARGATPELDAAQAAYLRANEKERAENLMIVDLIRNDLSRVALPHTVKVPRLFETQAWPTVWQMTSDVTASSRPGTRLSDVFGALFPCGSVTGVPKVRAMQLIRSLERSPRGVYCGAIGVLQPGGAATFSVGIRTVVLDGEGAALCGVGSGITSDATPDAERREWRSKRSFLVRASEVFDILETVLLRDGRLPHAPAHLARMARAAARFNYPWSPGIAAEARGLLESQAGDHPAGDWRLRLLLSAEGGLTVQAVAQPAVPLPVKVALAHAPLRRSQGAFVRFKTTRRAHYDALAPTAPDVFDSLLYNLEGEITEFTRGNAVFKIDGRWVTPALSCGLLDGVGRQWVLDHGVPPEGGADAGQPVTESVVRVADLARVAQCVFVNSCRGWLPAVLSRPA